jgi:hypothetical protein
VTAAIDIGHGHTLRFAGWYPDRELSPQFSDLPDIEKCTAIVDHPAPDGSACSSGAPLDSPGARRLFKERELWAVESWDPLTISPSLLCMRCGDHGFIRDGKWVPA